METGRGFYDLAIPAKVSPLTTLKELITRSIKLGYTSIAIETIIDDDYFTSFVKSKGQKKSKKKGDGEGGERFSIPAPPTLPVSLDELAELTVDKKRPSIFNRLTIYIGENGNYRWQQLKSVPGLSDYDIISIVPTTQDALKLAAGQLDIDIISFDASLPLPHLNRHAYSMATNREIHFELRYSALVKHQTLRKNLIHIAHTLNTAGKSKNIILSSGADNPWELRGPYDVQHMCALLQMTEEQAKASNTKLAKNVVLNSLVRKTGKGFCFVRLIPKEETVFGEPPVKKAKVV